MNSTQAAPNAPHTALFGTLRPLLQQQLGRLRARYLWHGVGLTVAIVLAAVLLFFSLDRWLGLPMPVRLLHTAVTATLLVVALSRFVRYPLSRSFAEVDLAIWFERTFPELHQRLVSAVQLHDLPDESLRNQSRPMIEQLLVQTADSVRALPLDRLFDPRPTTRAGLCSGGLALLLAVGAVWSPATMRAFLLRHLGFAASYPRETTLRLELPPAGVDLQRTDSGRQTEIVLPAGADLHVSVLAEGRTPSEVYLDVVPLREGPAGDVRSIAMAPRPGERFRHVFRRLSGSFQFHARGGDDDEGDRLVNVRTVFPPQVAMITANIRPPAYTGVANLEQRGGSIEALLGSDVQLTVTTTALVRSATMVFLESGRRLDLVATTPQDDSGASTVYNGSFALTASDRYQIELLADNGLRNPNPGTYPIAVLQDYAPIGRWLLPDDEGTVLLPGAILCVRVDGRDDFGLAAIDLTVERGAAAAITKPLLTATSPAAKSAVLTELLEVRDLLGTPTAGAEASVAGTSGAGTSGNDSLVLLVKLSDNRQPQPGLTELPRRIVQVVDEAQLAAAIARMFRGLREDISQALDLQSDRRLKLDDLVARSDHSAADMAPTLTGIEVGQGRIATTVERVHRGLMRAFDQHLWNRLEPSEHAKVVVDLYRQRCQELTEAVALDPAFYRDLLTRRAAGSLGALEQCLDPILAMIALADSVTLGPGPAVARSLAEAQVTRGASERLPLLQRAAAGQKEIEQSLQQLLLRLEEWNDYQDLVQEVRALRDRQRDLQGRTEDVRGKDK